MKYFLLAIASLFSLKTFGQGSLEGDRLALIVLYNATDGINWAEQSGWSPASLPGTNPCGWYGVTCEGGRVTGLSLNSCGLNGNIPAEIGDLNQLKTLILGWTLLATNARRADYYTGPYGPIPTEIGNLTNLEHLDLSGGTDEYMWGGPMPMTGPLPASLGNLIKLTYLDLSYKGNDLQYQGAITGNIPKELGNLVNLKYLDLSAQKFTGTIPAEIGNLVNLEYLGLRGPICCEWGPADKLTGPIPDLSEIPTSAVVSINYNAFTFDGLETNANKIDSYSLQAQIPIYMQGGKLYVEAGGTTANNTFKWYKESTVFGTPPVLEATIIGDNHFQVTDPGVYFVTVTNSIATGLTLTSTNYNVISLPVTLVYFQGKQDTGENQLTWKTTSETNNAGFEIEKSVDGKTFQKIGFIDGNGDTEEDKIYHFTDLEPLEITYYRLKQLDYDSTFEYSRIISLKGERAKFSIYPNPAKSHMLVSGLEKEEDMVVRNTEGRILLKQKVLPNQRVTTSNLSNGLYLIQIGGETKKILIEQ
ncbi:MAG: T9SS type A sorting domain-containing protein [Dyadobacter sp.]|uniref:T9SS type A sorting domain-containing protein n=1 Tax=Dyadobacter sp. TaxID=1914288 RepID=UPI003263239B